MIEVSHLHVHLLHLCTPYHVLHRDEGFAEALRWPGAGLYDIEQLDRHPVSGINASHLRFGLELTPKTWNALAESNYPAANS